MEIGMSENANIVVLMYVTKYGFEKVLSANIYWRCQHPGFSLGGAEQPTLAKKFEAVHMNTVIRRRNIPKGLLATFASPTPARKPRGFNADRDDDIESRSG